MNLFKRLVNVVNVNTCFTIFTVPVMVDPEKDSYFAVEIRPQFPLQIPVHENLAVIYTHGSFP